MSEVSLAQYPCDLLSHGETLFVALSTLTGEQWKGSLLVRGKDGSSHSLDTEHGVAALAASGIGDDYAVCAGTDSAELEVFACHKGAVKHAASLPAHSGPISAVATLSGDRVVSSSQDMRSVVWNVKQQALEQIIDLHGGPISLTAATAAGDAFASYSLFDRQLHVFRVGESEPSHSVVTPSEASAIAFAPGGASLLVGLYDGSVLTYDLKSFVQPRDKAAGVHRGAVRRIIHHGNTVISGEDQISDVFSLVLNLCQIESGGDDHVARVWGSDKVVRHADFVRGLAVYGGQLVTASWDKTLKFTAL